MLVSRTENDTALLEIHIDECPESPRKWDNLGAMVCWHSRYILGDKHDFSSPQEFREEVDGRSAILVPLYLLDHSGLTIRTDPTMFQACDPAGWDWQQIGFIYASHEKIRNEYGVKRVTKAVREKVIGVLEAEVATYDQYLRGEVYGYVLRDKKSGEEDSCWGFFGDLHESDMSEHLGEHAMLLNAASVLQQSRFLPNLNRQYGTGKSQEASE